MAPSKRRPPAAWSVERLSRLRTALEAQWDGYISQCHEAADRAVQFRAYWESEAEAAEATKRSMLGTVDLWIDYAGGKTPELMR